MKFENKFMVAYNEEKVIVAQSQGNGEIFVPSNVTVQLFDSERERAAYIAEEELTEENT